MKTNLKKLRYYRSKAEYIFTLLHRDYDNFSPSGERDAIVWSYYDGAIDSSEYCRKAKELLGRCERFIALWNEIKAIWELADLGAKDWNDVDYCILYAEDEIEKLKEDLEELEG